MEVLPLVAVACRFAAAASSGWAARTRSPSATTTPSSSARPRPPRRRGPSWSTLRSASRARASSIRRTGRRGRRRSSPAGPPHRRGPGRPRPARGGPAPRAACRPRGRTAGCPRWCRRPGEAGGAGGGARAGRRGDVGSRQADRRRRSARGVSVGERLLQRRAGPGRLANRKVTWSVSCARGVRQRLLGGSVEPLDVVDRQEQRPRVASARSADSTLSAIGWAPRGGPSAPAVERHVERAQLRWRQRGKLFGADAIEEVDQGGEGRPGLRAACPRREHPKAALGPRATPLSQRLVLPTPARPRGSAPRSPVRRCQVSDLAELSLPGDQGMPRRSPRRGRRTVAKDLPMAA